MIRILVEVLDLKERYVEEGCIEKYDPTGGENIVKKLPKDKYAELKGDGSDLCEVEVPYIEKVGGPGYSSVQVGVVIRVKCAQNAASIRLATDTLIKDAMQITDEHVDWGYKSLCAHVERLHGDE